MRVLGRIRLSRFSDESTSVERQRELIQRWADDNGHDVIGWAQDTDVSGSIDPFKTPALGPWLTDERAHDWDILVAWRLDRIARNARYMSKLFEWCYEHDRTLTTVSDSIDLSTTNGRMIATIIASLAEAELDAIRERTRSGRKKLVALGRWYGGRVPYGYRKRKLDTGGYTLDRDPVAAANLDSVIDRVLSGESNASIARSLNDAGVPAPSDHARAAAGKPTKQARWSPSTMADMLRSQSLLGQQHHNGNLVVDDRGEPVLIGPPLVDFQRWQRLQHTLEARQPQRHVQRRNSSPLIGVAVCWECGRNLQVQRMTAKGLRYYRCVNRCTQSLDADELEQDVAEGFLSEIGDLDELERVFIPGEDHTARLDEERSVHAELLAMFVSAGSRSTREQIQSQLEHVDARIQELEKLPATESRVEYRSTGRTYREAWESSDTDGRRALMQQAGVKARAKVTGRAANGRGGGVRSFEIQIPHDIRERLQRDTDSRG